jgi:uncharacterized membrane protein YcaP (DUF421 family)
MNEIQIFDFHRIFLGDQPLTFLLEIVFRTVIMYTYTILLLRFLGKRGMGQLSNLELAIIICFGSAVGDPMIGADMPIMYGITAITTVAFSQVGMEKFINRNAKIEKVMEGVPECLVDNGIILLDKLTSENLSHADLFRSLRNKEVFQLGEIKKAYFETSGDITVTFHNPRNVKAGLSVMPMDDTDSTLHKASTKVPSDGPYSCSRCGYTVRLTQRQYFNDCANCGHDHWATSAIAA